MKSIIDRFKKYVIYLGTYTENLMDSINHGNRTKRVRKLTADNVILIKKRISDGETLEKIAKDYDVHWVIIGNIKQKRTWKNVQITN